LLISIPNISLTLLTIAFSSFLENLSIELLGAFNSLPFSGRDFIFLIFATKNPPVLSLCGQSLLFNFPSSMFSNSIYSLYFLAILSKTHSFSNLFKVQVENTTSPQTLSVLRAASTKANCNLAIVLIFLIFQNFTASVPL
jgi:hypothetical protein